MPTAKGTYDVPEGNKFVATFTIGTTKYTFSADILPYVQSHKSDSATLTYSSTNQLTGTQKYYGKTGVDNVKHTLANGVKIEGDLEMPISPASTVDGSGTWTTG